MDIESLDTNKSAQKLKAEQKKFCEDKLYSLKLQCSEKLEGIERWRIKMKAKHGHDGPLPPVLATSELLRDDDELAENIKKKLLAGLSRAEDAEVAGGLFVEYIQKVKDREQTIQKGMAKAQNVKSHLGELMASRAGDEKKLFALEQESFKYKSSHSEIIILEKSLERQKEEKRAKGDSRSHSKEDEEYKQFIKKNNEAFKGVKKAYGAKVAEKMQLDHRKEIGELAYIQHAERRSEIKRVHGLLQRIGSTIESTSASEYLIAQTNLVNYSVY